MSKPFRAASCYPPTTALHNHRLSKPPANPSKPFITQQLKQATTDFTMNIKKEGSPAQTASVGDREMMTYMKLPIPSQLNRDSSIGPPSSNADSDDARFLDGLFERLSGSSDNGSDKGKEDGSNYGGMNSGSNSTSENCDNGGMTVHTKAATSTSSSMHDPLTALNLTNRYLQTAPKSPQGGESSGTAPSNDAAQPNAGTLPQHLLYTNDGGSASTAFLPQNLLNYQHQGQIHTQPHGQVQVQQVGAQQQISQPHHQPQHQHHSQFSKNSPTQLGNLQLLNGPSGMQPLNMNHPWLTDPPNSSASLNTGQGQAQVQVKTQQSQANIPGGASVPSQFAIPHLAVPGSSVGGLTTHSLQSIQSNQLQLPDMVQSMAGSASACSTVSANSAATGHGHAAKRRKSGKRGTPGYTSANRPLVSCSISEDESEVEKRRRDRNQREQERSQRIANQISDLKGLLTMSNVPFKPDKFSTLVSTHNYIKTLQQRSALLDAEQKKLVDTITKSNELVNKSQNGVSGGSDGSSSSSSGSQQILTSSGHAIIPSTSNLPSSEEDEILVFVRGLDYKSVFSRIRIALCVTSIDGRLLTCNDEFVDICKMSRETLVKAGLRPPEESNEEEGNLVGKAPLSLFNLVAREDMQNVFTAMGTMLKVHHPPQGEGKAKASNDSGLRSKSSAIKSDHWSGDIRNCHRAGTMVSLHKLAATPATFLLFFNLLMFSMRTHFH